MTQRCGCSRLQVFLKGRWSAMVEVISSLQPGASPALLLEWSLQTAKRANGGHFIFSSELTALIRTTQLQTEGYVCGLNESGVNS